ncbi:MAG TPA: phage holin family protein [Ginsengibacter sp.]|nr:phage holin family protein [Ginsengibacter sp.]HRP16628.1 phage holin family protein [Ginsengibacter sp.]HRP43956.1 phage holin family protein [Ginsengibacter sp.]
MGFIIRVLVSALVAYGLASFLEPHIVIDSYGTAILFVLLLGILNLLVKPILVLLTLPVTVLTLGIFLIVLNVLMVLLAGKLMNGVHIQSFWWALVFGVLLSFFTTVAMKIGQK